MLDTIVTADRINGRPFLGFLIGSGLAAVAWTFIGSLLWSLIP